MLRRERRLSFRDFDRVYRNSRAICGDFVCLRALRREGKPEFLRLACVVGKKLARRACRRNRLRRRLYAAAAEALADERGLDLIIIAKRQPRNGEFVALREDISGTFARLKEKIARAGDSADGGKRRLGL
ncbi:MAG TPA: ribonuclease P protein component [Candidatus Moranbacteria bacterium]|nr:ribonuclease P protein component [Candidatus Moranbacteria bacterium]